MKIIRIYILSFILWQKILGIISSNDYFKKFNRNFLTTISYNGLINYLKEESKQYQVVFIRDDKFDNIDSIINSLMMSVNANFPSLSINYNESEQWLNRYYTLKKYDIIYDMVTLDKIKQKFCFLGR